MSNLSQPHLHDEAAAYRFVEAILWPLGPVCPRCNETERVGKLNGKSTRIGVYKCYACRKPFNVKVGTVFECSHIPLHKWLQAILLLCASKKGFSSRQIARTLGLKPKSAWFLSHRIREAMRDGHLAPLGGPGKIIESDETFFGPKDVETNPAMRKRRRGKPGPGGKARVLTLVERGGHARSFQMENLKTETVLGVVLANVARESRLMTDEGTSLTVGEHFASHERVRHGAGEYMRGDVGTNTVEGFFSVFKRGMKGTYQHCAERHLHRYLAEFDFRYNARSALGIEDVERAERALRGVSGKRLTYRKAHPVSRSAEG